MAEPQFKTHIKEPRWQQWGSILLALGLFALWFWAVMH